MQWQGSLWTDSNAFGPSNTRKHAPLCGFSTIDQISNPFCGIVPVDFGLIWFGSTCKGCSVSAIGPRCGYRGWVQGDLYLMLSETTMYERM